MSVLESGRNCLAIELASRASVIIDADDYFRVAREAMLKARQQILLVGWDFDSRIRLAHTDIHSEAPATVGDFITWLVSRNPELKVYLLRWDKGALKTLGRGATLWTLTKWRFTRRIHLKLDGKHPTGASQHQKIVVIDDCLAFCGGIDMTSERWDTRMHTDEDPLRIGPSDKPYDPWHDATTALQGPVAARLGAMCRERWAVAGGAPIDPPTRSEDCWPETLAVDFKDVSVAISRSQPDYATQAQVLEIEQLYIDMIGSAQHRIYAESQYFASRKIAEAIAKRLAEPNGPEIVVINPLTAHGWLEPIAMDTARARLVEALKVRDPHKRLHIYHPMTANGTQIYVHAKILVIDETMIRVGSSNWNNRSMRLDTECDVTIDATLPGCGEASARIAAIRDGLLAEHLDVAPEDVAARLADGGSMVAAIEALRGSSKTLKPYEVPDLDDVQKWLADNEVLDPEGPGEMFEILNKPGLLRRLRLRR